MRLFTPHPWTNSGAPAFRVSGRCWEEPLNPAMIGYAIRRALMRILCAGPAAATARNMRDAPGRVQAAAAGCRLLQNGIPVTAKRSARSRRESAPLMKQTAPFLLEHLQLSETASLSIRPMRCSTTRQPNTARPQSTCARGPETTSSHVAG